MIEITGAPIDHAALTERVRSHNAGAVCTFLGTVREMTGEKQTVALEYEAYPDMALTEMQKIGETARERWRVTRVAIVHRIGVVRLGEASVVIAVSAAHRRAAFEACHFAIDRLKEVVPIWKKEHFEGGEIWIGSQTGKPFEGRKAPHS